MSDLSGRVVYNGHGRRGRLGDRIAEGGTADVYRLDDFPEVVAKIFRDEHIAAFGDIICPKVEKQVEVWEDFSRLDAVVWPRRSLHDADFKLIGYSMAFVQGVSLRYVIHPALQKMYYPGLDRFGILKLLGDLIVAVDALHKRDVFVGDFNLENFLVDPVSNRIFLIDTDGYQVAGHPCLVVRPEYLPPEHIELDAATLRRNRSSDAFSIAIVLFQSLMLTRYPYDVVGGGDLIANLRRGRFPYGPGGAKPGRDGAIPPGPWHLLWSHLPYAVKGHFMATFGPGARDPDRRTSLEEWRKALEKYGAEMSRGHHRREILPETVKSKAYRGKTILS